MVLDTVEHADRRPNSPTPASKLATILIQLTTSFGSEQDPQVVGMQGIWPLSNDHEISPGVRRLLESSLTPTTIRGYRTASQRRRGYDPFKLPTNQILEYLKDLFEEKKSHCSINTAMSALSFYLERREGMRVGELSDIARLCRGATRLHPNQPRYQSTWDIHQMLVHIGNLENNEKLLLRKLTKKLTMLLALATGGRSSDLLSYHTHLIEWTSSGVWSRESTFTKFYFRNIITAKTMPF